MKTKHKNQVSSPSKPLGIRFLILSIIIIIALGGIIYSNSFQCSFHYDDNSSIVDNFLIKNISDLQSIWNFWPCRFITDLSIAVNYHFNHLDVFGYHLFNLIVHVASGILVWWLVLLTFSTPVMKENKAAEHAGLIALLAGLVFVSHPVQTESVTYIVQRAASVTAFFYLASLCLYIQSRFLQDRGSGRIYYVGSLITAIAAMFTKENAITLPLGILLYEFCFLKTSKNINWKYLAPFLCTVLIIPLTMLLSNSVNFQEMHRTAESSAGISPVQYLLTEFRVMVTYLRLIFVPLHQNLDYDYHVSQSLFELPTLFSFLFLGGILFAAQRLFLKYRLVSFSIFWFFLTLLPESSFLPIKDVIYEHRLYLPLVGFSIFLVSVIYYFPQKNMVKTMVIALLMVIGINSLLTYERNKVWRDDYTLWSDVLQKSPYKSRPYNNLGKVYMEKGDLQKALVNFNKAIELGSVNYEAYNNRGCVYEDRGDYDQAILDISKAILIKPNYAEAYNNRGTAYNDRGNYDQAIADFNKAIELNPNYTDVYSNRGNAYTNKKRYSDAIADFNKAIELDPKNAKTYNNLAGVYFSKGDYDEAVKDYNKAIELNPNYADAYNNRGITYNGSGHLNEAILDYNKALELKPDLVQTYFNRGNAHYSQGNLDQAILDYNKALEIDPKNAQIYNNRGIIDSDKGNYDQAILDYNRAIELKPDLVRAYFNRGNAYYTKGDHNQAIVDYSKAIELDPNYTDAYNNRGSAYNSKGDYDKAILDYTKASRLSPNDPETYSNLGSTYNSSGHYNLAIVDLNKAIALKNDFAQAYINRSVAFFMQKEYVKSWADMHKAQGLGAKIDPKLLEELKEASGEDQ